MADTTTVAPSFCDTCLAEIVHGAGFTEDDPWRALVVVVQIALFQAATADRRVWERCSLDANGKRNTEDLSLVLAEIGCLGCFKPRTLGSLIADARRDGLSALAQRTRTEPYPDHDRPTEPTAAPEPEASEP